MKKQSIWEKPISHGEILKRYWKHLDLGRLNANILFTRRFLQRSAKIVCRALRVVVLRRFWRKPPRLAFHTHIGSPKIEQINQIIRTFHGSFITREKTASSHQRQSENSHRRRISRRTMVCDRIFQPPLLRRRSTDTDQQKTDQRFARRPDRTANRPKKNPKTDEQISPSSLQQLIRLIV